MWPQPRPSRITSFFMSWSATVHWCAPSIRKWSWGGVWRAVSRITHWV
mgnify:CR=1 FL=1